MKKFIQIWAMLCFILLLAWGLPELVSSKLPLWLIVILCLGPISLLLYVIMGYRILTSISEKDLDKFRSKNNKKGVSQ